MSCQNFINFAFSETLSFIVVEHAALVSTMSFEHISFKSHCLYLCFH